MTKCYMVLSVSQIESMLALAKKQLEGRVNTNENGQDIRCVSLEFELSENPNTISDGAVQARDADMTVSGARLNDFHYAAR